MQDRTVQQTVMFVQMVLYVLAVYVTYSFSLNRLVLLFLMYKNRFYFFPFLLMFFARKMERM